MKIYVGNLSFRATDEDLRAAFEPYGEVVSARVINDRETGRSRGFGFVEMSNNDQANDAIAHGNGNRRAALRPAGKTFPDSCRICLRRAHAARSFRAMSAAVPRTAGRGGCVE